MIARIDYTHCNDKLDELNGVFLKFHFVIKLKLQMHFMIKCPSQRLGH
jgi:hypothetical protein